MAIDLEKKKQASELIKNADKLLKNNDHASALEAVEQALQLDPSNLYAQAYRERIKSIMVKAGIEEKPKAPPQAPLQPESKPAVIPQVEKQVVQPAQEMPSPIPTPSKETPVVKEVPQPQVIQYEKTPKVELPVPAKPVIVEPALPIVQQAKNAKVEKPTLKELENENKTGKLRKLAAIMFTDMVSYTSLTQKNESLALKMLDRHQQMVRPLLRKYEGKEIKTVGDAFLVEFVSVLQAARCGLEIQKALYEYSQTAPADQKIELRIGIHLGDVIYMDNDILGDGVNIASRIQALANPGGIYVSQDVYNQIRNRDEFVIEYIAETQLKNILSPIPIYKLLTSVEVDQKNEIETMNAAISDGKAEARKQKLQQILTEAKQHASKGEDLEAWTDVTKLLLIDPHYAEAKVLETQIKNRRQEHVKQKIDQGKNSAVDEIQNVYKEVVRHALIEGELTSDERDIFLAWRRELSIDDSVHDTFLKELQKQKV